MKKKTWNLKENLKLTLGRLRKERRGSGVLLFKKNSEKTRWQEVTVFTATQRASIAPWHIHWGERWPRNRKAGRTAEWSQRGGNHQPVQPSSSEGVKGDSHCTQVKPCVVLPRAGERHPKSQWAQALQHHQCKNIMSLKSFIKWHAKVELAHWRWYLSWDLRIQYVWLLGQLFSS